MDQNNYFPLLPFSSSSSPPSCSSNSLSLTTTSQLANYGTDQNQGNYNNINEMSNGFLGLISEMDHQVMMFNNNNNNNYNYNDNNIPAGPNNVISTSGTVSQMNISSETEKKQSKGQKKIKKPRYAFQTRSQVDILDDGYRWRKYGQKAVKNNKFPRSYYRCTHQGCNVKKQVQRLTKDEGIVVTTYEGMHSHAIEKSTDNFEHILSQMQIYTSF